MQTADESAESQRAAIEAVDAAHVQRERPAQEMQQEDSTETLELPSAPGECSVTVPERIICRMEPINVTKCTEQSAPGECSVTLPERIIRRMEPINVTKCKEHPVLGIGRTMQCMFLSAWLDIPYVCSTQSQYSSVIPAELQEVAVRAEAASEVGPREGAPPKTAPPRNASGGKTALKKVAAKAPPVVFPLPMTREEAVQGAVEGILRAWAAGEHLVHLN